MAEPETDPDDRTEIPSERRLRQMRDEGQVALGRDATSVASLLGAFAGLLAVARPLRDALGEAFAAAASSLDAPSFSALAGALARPALLSLVPPAAGALAAALATAAQTAGGFWPHLALPDPSRAFSPDRVLRAFTREGLADLGLSAVKVVAVGAAAYLALRDDFLTLGRLLHAPAGELLAGTYAPLGRAAVKVLAVMAALAGADLALTRRRYRNKVMMTRDEARREHREDEGDPLLRARRRRRHRELARGRAATEVPRADVVVVNPTHVAVAVRYRRAEDAAPRVTAKGKGKLAELMRALAREHGVPIVEDVALARLLHRKVKVGRKVPADTYRAVAAILAFVYRLSAGGGR
ncbi:MAG TPA: EscU/YscU/HrcU family type III secretion system export apparatus switch protein [Myxococcales bacterium]|jgi:flagellar biosynthesis protein FlhB|nr:EscU/YscU/HrcU family type III secretion system export apparatus switch protein [Myxococcales bacterium]